MRRSILLFSYRFTTFNNTCDNITTKSNISHCFIDKLQEGFVYLMHGFSVEPNKEVYRTLKGNIQVFIQYVPNYRYHHTANTFTFLLLLYKGKMVRIQLYGVLLTYVNWKYIKICGVRFWIIVVKFMIKYTTTS